MPRNGSNVYTVPPGTEGSAGATILSSAYNAFLADLETDLNAARPISAGGTGATSVITAWDALAAKGTDIASATSINLTTATGPSLTITGTTTITSVTLAEGSFRLVRAGGAFQITASASLLVNGSASTNITTAANDLLLFRGGSGGVVTVARLNSTAVSTASTTEVLTGTDTAKAVTADALAALWEKGTNVASAATVSLGEGGFFHITGTTTITDIDFATAKDGRIAYVVFDGALTLTHNATTLILPGAANITTAAGDRAIFVQDSGDNVICISYTKADGTPIVGGITLGTPQSPSGVAQVDFTSIPSTAKQIVVMWQGLSSASNSSFGLQIGDSGGIENTGYNQSSILFSTAAASNVVSAATTWSIGSAAAANSLSGVAVLTLMDATTFTWAVTILSGPNATGSANDVYYSGSGYKSTSAALDRLRIFSATGNLDAGKINIAYI